MDQKTQEKVNRLQDSLSTLRKVAGWSAEDLGELLDVTRQTIVNLETAQTKMTKVQYMAIRLAFQAEVQENNNDTLARLLSILVDCDNLDEENRVELKKTVDTAANSVGRRAGASAASKAAIAALIPVLTRSVFSVSTVASALSVGVAFWDTFKKKSKK